MRQNITTSDDCREIAIFNLTFPDSRKQFFQTPTAYEKNNDRNVTMEVYRLLATCSLVPQVGFQANAPLFLKKDLWTREWTLDLKRFSGLEKYFRTPNNIVVFLTVFFFDLTIILRFQKQFWI